MLVPTLLYTAQLSPSSSFFNDEVTFRKHSLQYKRNISPYRFRIGFQFWPGFTYWPEQYSNLKVTREVCAAHEESLCLPLLRSSCTLLGNSLAADIISVRPESERISFYPSSLLFSLALRLPFALCLDSSASSSHWASHTHIHTHTPSVRWSWAEEARSVCMRQKQAGGRSWMKSG